MSAVSSLVFYETRRPKGEKKKEILSSSFPCQEATGWGGMFSHCKPAGSEIRGKMMSSHCSVRIYGGAALVRGWVWGGPYQVDLFKSVLWRRVKNARWVTSGHG